MVGLPGLVIAEPSAGKTTFALSIAKGKGQAGGKTLYISLDGIARIYGAENYENIKLVEMTRPTIDEIRNVSETMCAEREYSLAVVDYINLIEGDDIIPVLEYFSLVFSLEIMIIRQVPRGEDMKEHINDYPRLITISRKDNIRYINAYKAGKLIDSAKQEIKS